MTSTGGVGAGTGACVGSGVGQPGMDGTPGVGGGHAVGSSVGGAQTSSNSHMAPGCSSSQQSCISSYIVPSSSYPFVQVSPSKYHLRSSQAVGAKVTTSSSGVGAGTGACVGSGVGSGVGQPGMDGTPGVGGGHGVGSSVGGAQTSSNLHMAPGCSFSQQSCISSYIVSSLSYPFVQVSP
jgi:hypothetical protein